MKTSSSDGPRHADRADGYGESGEQAGYELLAGCHGEGDRALVHRGLDAEFVREFGDRRLVVPGVDLYPVLADARLERLRGVDRHDLPMVDDCDPVAVLRLVHVMRGEEDRDVLAALQFVDVLPDRRAGLRVEARPSARRGTARKARAAGRARSQGGAASRPSRCLPGCRAGPTGRPCRAPAASAAPPRPWERHTGRRGSAGSAPR